MVTTLGDFFEGVRKLLQLDIQTIKKTLTIKEGVKKDVVIKTAPLKIAHLANSTLNLDSRICDHYSSGWINYIINLRHMFVHERGLFKPDAKPHMVNAWANLEAGDPITFDQNKIDSILWFFNDHVRDFTTRLDEKLPLPL